MPANYNFFLMVKLAVQMRSQTVGDASNLIQVLWRKINCEEMTGNWPSDGSTCHMHRLAIIITWWCESFVVG